MYRWFQSRALPVRDKDDRISGWYMSLTDVDDRKRNEVALATAHREIAKSEAELRAIIDAIPQLIVVFGAGDYLYANHAFMEHTGLTSEEVTPEGLLKLRHPDDTERVVGGKAAIPRWVPFEYERRVRRGDGQFRCS